MRMLRAYCQDFINTFCVFQSIKTTKVVRIFTKKKNKLSHQIWYEDDTYNIYQAAYRRGLYAAPPSLDYDFSLFLFIFFNRFNITRSGGQKYELIGNFKSFKKMCLHPADMQTRRRKKISIFPYFSLFYLTDLILLDRADKNMNW